MSGVVKATIENKTTSVATHFKKLTTGNNVLLVIVQSSLGNCHIVQFLHQIFYVSALLLDDALKPATPLINGAMKRCDSLPHSVTIACFSWLIVVNVDVDNHLLKGTPKQRNRLDSSLGCLGAICQAR